MSLDDVLAGYSAGRGMAGCIRNVWTTWWGTGWRASKAAGSATAGKGAAWPLLFGWLRRFSGWPE